MIPAEREKLLEVEDLVMRYPVPRGVIGGLTGRPKLQVHAVDGVSFSVGAGEMVALVGESGCGKTSTAQTVIRMLEPQRGRIRFGGTDITHLSTRRMRALRREIQIIYQDPYESLDPRFRVRETVEEPLIIHGIGGGSDERSRTVMEGLERAGLDPPELYLDRYPHELSGGQRQRVAIAASLVLGPKLLIADEPVSMLDVSVRAGILELLAGLRRSGLGILMITHDLSTAVHYADRIAVMYLGRIVETGPAKEIVRRPRHPYTRALISVVPGRDPETRSEPELLKGEIPDPTAIPSGCRFHTRCPLVIEECVSIDPHLRPTGTAGHEAACILVGTEGEQSGPSARQTVEQAPQQTATPSQRQARAHG
jgi:peptide/nickel transport system ATP-binding protein